MYVHMYVCMHDACRQAGMHNHVYACTYKAYHRHKNLYVCTFGRTYVRMHIDVACSLYEALDADLV